MPTPLKGSTLDDTLGRDPLTLEFLTCSRPKADRGRLFEYVYHFARDTTRQLRDLGVYATRGKSVICAAPQPSNRVSYSRNKEQFYET